MSGAGVNPLAILAPDLYAKQLAIQRRQALAQSLMESGEGPTGSAAYGGLRNAGNAILGAFLAKRGDQDMANLYSPQPDQGQPAPMPSPQVSNAPPGGSPGPVQGAAPAAAPSPQISNTPPSGPSPQALGQALQGGQPQQAPMPAPQMASPAQQPRSIPSVMGNAIPDLPGMTHQQSMLAYFQSPQAYFTALAAANAPTPEQKNANFATGNNPGESRQLVMGGLMKGASDNLRPGGGSINYATGNVITMPNTNGVQTTFPNGINSPAQMGLVPGAAPALAGSAMATNAGIQAVKPNVAFDASGMPVATNNLAMTGNPSAQNLIPSISQPATQAVESGGNPGAISAAGARGPMQTMPGTLSQPGFGVQAAQNGTPQEQGRVGADYQQALMAHYKNPVVATIAYNMGPGATDKWLANGGNFSDLPEETQKYLGRIAVAQAIPQKQSAPQANGLMPALPASQAPYMAGQGKDASDRHDQTITEAQGSPDRINVLDNILKLSQSGVASGPGQEFQQSVLGYAANVPGLSKVLGGAKDNVAKFQELQKFLLQNGQRAWQAAGGTGTDAQLNAASHANPNDAQFPQALQTITKWVKAGELAVQGKANAQDAFLQVHGNTAQNQITFENLWRNNLDRRAYQLQTMAPQEQQAFVKGLAPADAKILLQKRQNLRALGGLQ